MSTEYIRMLLNFAGSLLEDAFQKRNNTADSSKVQVRASGKNHRGTQMMLCIPLSLGLAKFGHDVVKHDEQGETADEVERGFPRAAGAPKGKTQPEKC
ncbi:MAG: hypothetical protein SOV63_11545 [Pyramidobacter porci]|nr:hypothetical protein [Pyramidobacter porci]MDY2649426.1 hypothetical protein [Pyramidobacter porci]